jgi:hypothetical protein
MRKSSDRILKGVLLSDAVAVDAIANSSNSS